MMKTELTDGRILLRPYGPQDIDSLYEAVRESLAELSPWMPWAHADYAKDESRAFIMSRDEARANEEEYGFGIFDAQTLAYLGGVGINAIVRKNRYANLGYWVRTGRTGRGVASGATRLLARFGLEELGFVRIEVIAAVSNLASRRTAEKAGAVFEGILRKRLWLHDRAHDAALYSLVAEDFS